MKNLKTNIAILFCVLAAACAKVDPSREADPSREVDPALTGACVNIFAHDAMELYYLWNKEIADGLASWSTADDPMEKVLSLRYRDASGIELDRWSEVTDDYEGFIGSVSGVEVTFGYDLSLCYLDSRKMTVGAVVNFVYAGSPAEKAGLRRGDVIVRVNGRMMSSSNYTDIVAKELFGGTKCVLDVRDGITGDSRGIFDLTPVRMYEDPVLLSKVFDCGGRKVGYLFYTGFTDNSCGRLVEVCSDFKKKGVSEVIIDLRYNGGGYVLTEQALASLFATDEMLDGHQVFQRNVYNDFVTEAFGGADSTLTCFSRTGGTSAKSYDIGNSNLGLEKLYAIVDSGTASASEGLVCGLIPYMEVVLIGGTTHGKYCSGIVLPARDWFDDSLRAHYTSAFEISAEEYARWPQYVDNWGLYVMIGRYSDKNGLTRCMPSGFTPDIPATDDFWDGFQLGDPNETMLAKALEAAGYSAVRSASPADGGRTAPDGGTSASGADGLRAKARTGFEKMPDDLVPRRPRFGKSIVTL